MVKPYPKGLPSRKLLKSGVWLKNEKSHSEIMTYAPYYPRLVPERNRATATRMPEVDDTVGRRISGHHSETVAPP
jgi:hypothetical protein